MRSALFWEWKKLQRAEWWYLLPFIPLIYLDFDSRFDYQPTASETVGYFFGVAITSIFLLSFVFGPRDRPSDLAYVLSRPQEASRVWPIRLVKLFLVASVFTLTMSGSSNILKAYVHDNKFYVSGCDALYQYDKAGFEPIFSDIREYARYSWFRTGVSTSVSDPVCKEAGIVRIPGFADRLLIVTLLSALSLSAAAVTLLATSRLPLGDRARNAGFWLALLPSLFGVAMYVRLFAEIGSKRTQHIAYDGPLVIYQATPWLVTLLVAVAISYLILAHITWKRIEVLR